MDDNSNIPVDISDGVESDETIVDSDYVESEDSIDESEIESSEPSYMDIMPLEWSNNQVTQALNHFANISNYTNTTSTRVNTLNTTLTQTNVLLTTINQNITVLSGKVDHVTWIVALFLCFYVAQYFMRRLFYRG